MKKKNNALKNNCQWFSIDSSDIYVSILCEWLFKTITKKCDSKRSRYTTAACPLFKQKRGKSIVYSM